MSKLSRGANAQESKSSGYDDATRLVVVKLYVDGMNMRRIGRTLG